MTTDVQRLMVSLEASATKFEKELARASDVARRRLRGIDDQFTASNRRVTDGMARSAAAYRAGATGAESYRFAVQNAAFQVGDFAVQVAAGTSAARAMAMQLPQLLGGMGMWGAIMGTVAAVAIPLGAALFGAADAAKQLNAVSLEQLRGNVKELRELQSAYNDLVRASGPIQSAATREKLSALDAEYQAKLALFKLDAVTLEQKKRQLEASLADQRAALNDIMAQATALDNPDADSAAYTRTAQQAAQLDLVQAMLAENEDMTLEIRRQQAELDLVNLSLGEAQSAIAGATGLAGSLAAAFGQAAQNAAAIRVPGAALRTLDDERGSQGATAADVGRLRSEQALDAANDRVRDVASPRVVGGAGGGAARVADPAKWLREKLEAAQAQAEAARIEATSILHGSQAAAEAKARFDLLAEAKRQNMDLDKRSAETGLTLRDSIDRQAASIAALTTQAERYRERAQFMESQTDTLKNGFLDAIVAGESFGDALADVARALAKAALQAALFGDGPFGGGGSMLSTLGSALFGGFRAEGGPVTAGRAYVVGEQGPEIMVPRHNGTIIPNGGGNAEGGVSLSISIDARGAQVGVAEQINAQLRAALPSIVRQAVQGVGAAQKRGY